VTQDPLKAAKARALVASLLFIEAAVVGALALWLIFLTLTADSFELLPFLGVLLFAIAGTVGLSVAAMGFQKGNYFGRSPAVLANLIALGVVSYQVDAHLWIIAIPLGVLAVTTLIAALRAIPTDF